MLQHLNVQLYLPSKESSVGDPDPQDPDDFGPPGSGSINQGY